MKTSTQIGAAVAFAMAAAAANAAPLTYAQLTTATAVYASGSSAFQTSLEKQLINIGGNTLTKYKDSADGKSFLAYAFTVVNPGTDLASIANTNIVLYYRVKGGSVWGPGPIAKNIATATLALPTSAACGASQTTMTSAPNGPANTCTIGSYTLNTDGPNPVSGLQYHLPDWGLSDVNPKALSGENWVDATSGAGALGVSAPTYSNITATTVQMLGQTFSVVINKNGPAGGVSSLRKQDLTAIFSGSAGDWSQLGDPVTRAPFGTGAITVCRRDPGSGTQTTVSSFFNAAGCSPASYAFVASTSTFPTISGVTQNNSTGNMLDCVNNNSGAIGFAVLDSGQTQMTNNGGNVKVIGYDDVTPSKTNAANGSYQLYAEASSTIRPSLGAGTEKTFISGVQARLQDVSTFTAADSLVGIPNLAGAASNTATLPITVVSGNPVAIGTTGGNICAPLQNQD